MTDTQGSRTVLWEPTGLSTGEKYDTRLQKTAGPQMHPMPCPIWLFTEPQNT